MVRVVRTDELPSGPEVIGITPGEIQYHRAETESSRHQVFRSRIKLSVVSLQNRQAISVVNAATSGTDRRLDDIAGSYFSCQRIAGRLRFSTREAAYLCGFKLTNYFCRVLKSTRMSPLGYRESMHIRR